MKTVWCIYTPHEIYHNVEKIDVGPSGLMHFVDPNTGLRVWIGPSEPWHAVEKKSI